MLSILLLLHTWTGFCPGIPFIFTCISCESHDTIAYLEIAILSLSDFSVQLQKLVISHSADEANQEVLN